MTINVKKALSFALASGILFAASTVARAVTFTTSGLVGGSPVSASADLTTVGTNLVITLKNTTPGGTPTKTQVLSGLFFSVNGADPALTLPGTGTTLASGSVLYTDATHSSLAADINGSFLLLSHPGGVLSSGFQYEYGIGSTGSGGLFPANQFTKGGGGDDYAIVATGTDMTQSSFGSQFPYEMNAVQFTLNGWGATNLSSISNVAFTFGSDGTQVLAGTSTSSVPEPGTFALLIGAGLSGSVVALRRVRQRRSGKRR